MAEISGQNAKMNEVFRKVALSVQNRFKGFDSAIDRMDEEVVDNHFKPVFIVGPPRSGTTLLFQLLLSQYKLSYISNVMAAFPKYMVTLCGLSPHIASNYTGGVKKSYYGYISGLLSPNEAGRIVDEWFGVGGVEIDSRSVRRTIASISSLTQSPMLIKSLFLSMKINKINEVLPSARFIYLKRDPVFTAQSILLAREKIEGSASRWWSVKPPGYESILDKDPCYQVAWQVATIERSIYEKLSMLDEGRQMHITYEDLCNGHDAVLKEVEARFSLRFCDSCQKQSRDILLGDRKRLDDVRWAKIKDALDEVTDGH
ncbi:MAG: sulfotransferase [Sedimenticola sp.]